MNILLFLRRRCVIWLLACVASCCLTVPPMPALRSAKRSYPILIVQIVCIVLNNIASLLLQGCLLRLRYSSCSQLGRKQLLSGPRCRFFSSLLSIFAVALQYNISVVAFAALYFWKQTYNCDLLNDRCTTVEDKDLLKP